MPRGSRSQRAKPTAARDTLARSSRRPVKAAAAVTAGALALAGCGGVAAQGSQGQATASAKCGKTIKIGAPLPFSGPLQEFGTNSYQGMQVAVNEINAAGGIKSVGGAKLTLLKADVSSFDTGQATSATTQLVSEGVVAMSGAWLSAQTVPVEGVAESSKVPLISQAWADALSANGNQYYFQPPAVSSKLGASGTADLVAAAKAAGVTFKRVTAIAPNDVANETQYKAAIKEFEAKGAKGQPPTFYTPGLTDVTPIVNIVKREHPDLILTGGSPADSVLIVKGLRSAGINTPIMSFGGGFGEQSFAQALGSSVNGILDVTTWNDDLKLDGVSQAASDYEKAYNAKFMPAEAGESWVAIEDVADAINQAKSCSSVKIAQALHSIDITSGPGSAMPPGGVSFTKQGTNPNAVPILVQWQGDVPRTIAPAKVATASFQKPAGS